MSSKKLNLQVGEAIGGRSVGGTEHSWCRAVLGGTGIVVLAMLSSKQQDVVSIENALRKVQNSHPILMSKLCSNTPNTFSLVKSDTPYIKINTFDISSTTNILNEFSDSFDEKLSSFQIILEHELNKNTWYNSDHLLNTTNTDILHANIYKLSENKTVFIIRVHSVACDRTTGVTLLNELLTSIEDKSNRSAQLEIGNKGEINLGIEDLIPSGKAKKRLWEHGMDVLGYSVNSLRLTNLKFKDSKSRRWSQIVRFQIDQNNTERIFACCKRRGIKLCGALAAAGLMAAHGSSANKSLTDHHRKKYGVVTLLDCRSILHPPLSKQHFGFYHSAIMNTQVMKGGETLWELAKKMYAAFESSKNSNKHLTDMADLNYLMCKAIDNPGLTQSSSLRTSFMSVFEDTVVDNSDEMQSEIGLEDFVGCASVHGIGPSIGIFDTVRDGRLDCVCVYPAPLHSREQMQELVDKMKRILVKGSQIGE